MVLHYKRKTERCSWTTEQMEKAIRDVNNGASRRLAAGLNGVPRATLRRYLDGKNKKTAEENSSILGRPKQQEDELVGHILEFEKRGSPLTVVDIRILAYDFVKLNNICQYLRIPLYNLESFLIIHNA